MRVLFVCTANTGRSALAESLLRTRVHDEHAVTCVESAGIRATPGERVSELVAQAARVYDGDLSGHRSRLLTADMVSAADLVVAMGVEHRDHVVRLVPSCIRRTFLLRDLAIRARLVGDRRTDEPLQAYVGRLADAALSATLHPGLDIADPYGQPVEVLWSTVADINRLLGELVTRLFPTPPYAVSPAQPGD